MRLLINAFTGATALMLAWPAASRADENTAPANITPVSAAPADTTTPAGSAPFANSATFDSGKLLATTGVSSAEGAGGGALAAWGLITGYGTQDSIGANAHYTFISLPDYTLHSAGAAVGVYDRFELSYAHQWFDTGATGAKLGLGEGFTFQQDIIGAKVRLLGDAVYDQDSLLPQNRHRFAI